MERSDTPRTDLLAEIGDFDELGRWVSQGNGECVATVFAQSLERELATATRERDEARADLETERMRLAACGVIALANTPDSAAKARDMLPQYRSASSDDVARAVDREMLLRSEVERLRSALDFYSQPVRYDGPNQRPIPGDPYTTADSAYMNDVCRDGGEIARAALAATEPKP